MEEEEEAGREEEEEEEEESVGACSYRVTLEEKKEKINSRRNAYFARNSPNKTWLVYFSSRLYLTFHFTGRILRFVNKLLNSIPGPHGPPCLSAYTDS